MRASWVKGVMAGAAVLSLAACSGNQSEPQLMNLRATSGSADEFAILPTKPLEIPQERGALPEPTPGGANRTDPTPQADAIAALGGRASVAGAGVPAADGALMAQAGRFGAEGGIRSTLASEDLAFRRDNDGRLLERLFNLNTYYRAYEPMSLDQTAELARWRRLGARTPSAPPPPPEE